MDDGHGISRPKREASVSRFNKWLNDDNRVVIEPQLTLHSEKELNGTPGGQINSIYPDERNIQDLNLAAGREMETARKAFGEIHGLPGYQKQIKELLNFNEQPKEIYEELVGEELNESYKLIHTVRNTMDNTIIDKESLIAINFDG